MNTIGPGFNNYEASYSMIDKAMYKTLVDAYSGFTNQSHDFRKMLSKLATDLDKLKAKFAQTKSESLGKVIERKEQTMAMMNQSLDEAREGYFEEGNAIAQQVSAYLGVTTSFNA
jgi:hypothetical protein